MKTESICNLLGGSPRALQAAQRIAETLTAYDLPRASIEQLQRVGRISPRQAATLYSAIQLAGDLAANPYRPGERFSNSRDLWLRYRSEYESDMREHFVVLILDSKNCLIRRITVSTGSLSTNVVHPREVYRAAVRDSAAALLAFHNHPSGDPCPSREDRDCTQRLFQAGKILGIRLLDHIIIGRDDYFSFADAGLLAPEAK